MRLPFIIALFPCLLALLPAALRAQVVTNAWTGAGADALASTAGNWLLGVPLQSHHILLDSTSHKNLTWDSNAVHSVAGWRQVGYTGTVTMGTCFPGQGAFTHLTIGADAVLSNGVWTHPSNTGGAIERERLSVAVLGNLILGSNASIQVTGKGFAANRGPGCPPAGEGGGSYGGVGSEISTGPCYGSVIAPTNLGSGGRGNTPHPGGGAVRLTNDYTVGDIRLDTAGAWLDLGSNTLYVNTLRHDLAPGSVTHYGAIIWLNQGSLLTLR